MVSFDTVIVGGGIIGCSLARALAGQGVRVAVIERSAPGEEASGAAAGMLAPSAEAEFQNPLFVLARRSLELYPALAAELRAETGIDPQYRAEGTLLPFADAAERDRLHGARAWQRDFQPRELAVRVEVLSADELRRREPHLAAKFFSPDAGAIFLPGDHQIDNRLLMHALVQSCRQRGVEFLLGKSVTALELDSGRAAGVRLDGAGTRLGVGSPTVINAAGAWAARIPAAGLPAFPVRPVKGHMLALGAPPGTLRHVIRTPQAYLVPRTDGRILVGSTMEEAGFDKTVRAAPLSRLLCAAQQLCPALETAQWLEGWTGLRPATPDGLPLLGPTAIAGYWTALGHLRNGILLAPITAEILSAWLLGGAPPFSVDAFSPQRFAC